jgi:hypothetical protein
MWTFLAVTATEHIIDRFMYSSAVNGWKKNVIPGWFGMC